MTLGPEHLTGPEGTLRPGNIVARESKINGETADRIGPRTGPEAPKFNRALRSLRARLNFQALGRVRGPVSRPEDFVGLARLNASGRCVAEAGRGAGNFIRGQRDLRARFKLPAWGVGPRTGPESRKNNRALRSLRAR